MFDDLSPWIALTFVGTLAIGAAVLRLLDRPRRSDDRIHPAE